LEPETTDGTAEGAAETPTEGAAEDAQNEVTSALEAPLDDPAKTAEAVQQTISEQAQDIWWRLENLWDRLMNPWSGYQILIILALGLVSYSLYKFLRPRLREVLGRLQGWPKWSLRVLAVLNQRLFLVIFALLSQITIQVMLVMFRWPSRTYFISVFASLALAWLFIAIVSRLIKNRSLRKLVSWIGLVYVTLVVVGLWDEAKILFDSLAVTLGQVRISALMIFTAIFTLACLLAIANIVSKSIANRIEKVDEEDMSASIKVLMTKGVQLAIYGLAIMLALRTIGFDLSSFALLSGAIGLGIGFGLQKIVSNLVSGIIILLDKSIKPGDVISLEGTFGWITSLGARYASIETRDGREYLIPNEDFITSQVINWTHSSSFVRLDIDFGVAYDSDPHLVKKVCTAAPLTVDRVVNNPAPVCHIINFGDSSIDFRLRFWIEDPTGGLTNIRGNVFLALWDALKENDIEIPFPRRDVQILNPTPTPPINPIPDD
jgi:small-conductance mechanosensitive channel